MAATPTRSARTLRSRLAGQRILICMGAGGVGKTTISAALALGLAQRGAKVAVVTIDPAKRLASALGLAQLSSDPRRITPQMFAAQGVEMEGELWAMMLDAKRTFDEIVARLAPDERAREEIFSNSVYRELSTAVAGSHELSAIAKLYELHEEHDFDVIVLDTPPSRNALDFLSAPARLLGFLEGRALQVFLAPGGLTARLFGRGTALVFSIFARVTGVDMLAELSTFFRSLSGVIDGFGARTREVAALLRAPQTSFVVVTSPEPEPAREAMFVAERLAAAGMGMGELVVNRVHSDGLGDRTPEQVRAMLAPDLGEALAGRVASNLADFDVLVRRDQETIARLSEELGEREPTLVPQLDKDVQDLQGLGRIAEYLFA
ncbi:MAG TPA: ArsA-related P-loop ATPase [Solirubrobacteraceae bacterium]|nr:ArsA-related P-loop ATPase [Solirubrobacteraceae bacterium]